MKIRLDDWIRILVLSLIAAPAIAFMTFDFVFPNISTPSLQKNLLVAFLLSILFGMPAGYMTRRTDIAAVTVVVYVLTGYILAVIAYSAPFLFYDFSVIFPGQYVLFFLNMSVILVMLFFLGGIIGVILGQVLRESCETDETSQVFSRIRP
ncbi:MAG: hypothetical protein LN411_00655 [Candidatus Thermoplasmatota archaeon]|nr:hypothetical protein [Candidatus Thermoplasmatota archaeon]